MYSPAMKEFMVKVVERSGLSQNGTYLPPAIHPQHTADVSVYDRRNTQLAVDSLASTTRGRTHHQVDLDVLSRL